MLEGARDEEARCLRYLIVRDGAGSLGILEAMMVPGEEVEGWECTGQWVVIPYSRAGGGGDPPSVEAALGSCPLPLVVT